MVYAERVVAVQKGIAKHLIFEQQHPVPACRHSQRMLKVKQKHKCMQWPQKKIKVQLQQCIVRTKRHTTLRSEQLAELNTSRRTRK